MTRTVQAARARLLTVTARSARPDSRPARATPPAPAEMAERVRALTRHAAALADRIEALPVPADPQARQDRQERVARLRAAERAGQAFLPD